MECFKVCFGNEYIADDGYIGIPTKTSFCIKSNVYDVYAYLENDTLKELVTGIVLKPYSEIVDDVLEYYSVSKVSLNEVACFIKKIRTDNIIEEYKDKIHNVYERQKVNRFDGLESLEFSDKDTILSFIKRRI